jgi:hypothetical protein
MKRNRIPRNRLARPLRDTRALSDLQRFSKGRHRPVPGVFRRRMKFRRHRERVGQSFGWAIAERALDVQHRGSIRDSAISQKPACPNGKGAFMASDELVWLRDLLHSHERSRRGHHESTVRTRRDWWKRSRNSGASLNSWSCVRLTSTTSVVLTTQSWSFATDQKPGGDVHVLRLTMGRDFYAWEVVLKHVRCILQCSGARGPSRGESAVFLEQ